MKQETGDASLNVVCSCWKLKVNFLHHLFISGLVGARRTTWSIFHGLSVANESRAGGIQSNFSVQEAFSVILRCNCSNGCLVSSLTGYGKCNTAELEYSKCKCACLLSQTCFTLAACSYSAIADDNTSCVTLALISPSSVFSIAMLLKITLSSGSRNTVNRWISSARHSSSRSLSSWSTTAGRRWTRKRKVLRCGLTLSRNRMLLRWLVPSRALGFCSD